MTQREYSKRWYKMNKIKHAAYNKEYREKNKGYYQNYYSNNKNKIRARKRAYELKRYQTDPQYRILKNLRRRMILALSVKKVAKSMDLVGCTIEELKSHLAAKFQTGMSFENYGKWHIDHIVPCLQFDLTGEEGQRKCFHFSNLQPLWAHDNLVKGTK